MLLFRRLALFLLICCIYGFRNANEFVKFARKSRDSQRRAKVLNSLAKVKGVYRNSTLNNPVVDNSVVVTVAAFNHETISHYKIYFQNFKCFADHYGIKLVVYILHHDVGNFEEMVSNIGGSGIEFLKYPDELFWKLISQKSMPYKEGKGHGDYMSHTPTFSSFGALVMLVPVLEIVELGYNVIFFDVDLGLVQDPIPYLVQGDADIVSSLEIRQCPEFYPSSTPSEAKWETIEPNTGVMFVRSTPQGIAFYRNWLKNIVDQNILNDQRVFDREKIDATYTPNCNTRGSFVPTKRKRPSSPTYCFLSETLFQNGMVGVICPSKAGYRDDWVLEMRKHATPVVNSSTGETAYFPVIVHANYCNGKSHELVVRGLWLYQEKTVDNVTTCSCKAYRMQDTYYAAVNWTAEVEFVENKRAYMRHEFIQNGTLVQRNGGREIFLIDEQLRKRLVPDKDTYEAMFGENWGLIKVIPTEIMEKVPLGEPLPKITAVPWKAER